MILFRIIDNQECKDTRHFFSIVTFKNVFLFVYKMQVKSDRTSLRSANESFSASSGNKYLNSTLSVFEEYSYWLTNVLHLGDKAG